MQQFATNKESFQKISAASEGLFGLLRQSSWAEFSKLGLPDSSQNEDWKYTNVQSLAKQKFALNFEQQNLQSFDQFKIENLATNQILFVNGNFVSAKLDSGVKVTSIKSASQDLTSANAKLLKTHLGQYATSQDQSLVALNTSFINDGVLIEIDQNQTIKNPIEILFVTTVENCSTHPRVLALAGKSSSAQIIERYFSLNAENYFTNPVCEVVLEQAAQIDYVKVQQESKKAYHLARFQAKLQRDCNLSMHNYSFGGATVRNEIYCTLDGQNITCSLNGLSILDDNQHVDNHTLLDHAQPHSQSFENYKGVYNDSSAGVFSGTIIVRKDAQKTNAFQSNRSLLLSDKASIDSRPQLKIWADDVKCTHGATVGQLDQDAMFYLRSRGISKTQAQKILVQAFVGDITALVKNPQLRQYLESLALAKLK